jgi:two-component system phosphate regulon sensor histidine kinase PhoR
MIESGTDGVRFSAVDLRSLLDDCLDVIRSQFETKGVDLQANLPDRLPTIDIDRRLFSVAVLNILGNALNYTPEGGAVTVSTPCNEKELVISIQDTGIGIAEEHLPQIFEKFFRCPSPEVAELSGSGTGLTSAQEIVRLHDGEIRVRSIPGRGSQFMIVLPRSLITLSSGG